MKKVLSYGGGVQTFSMLILIEKGILQKPDFGIMADTLAEYPETEEHLNKVAIPLFEKLGIPFFKVVHEEGIIKGYKKTNSIPMPGFRSCTYHYKVQPIHRKFKEILGDDKKNGVASIECWIGISTDEARRQVKREDQSPKWVLQTYPLLELGYSRQDCIDLIEKSEYPMPRKSGCFMCPYSGRKGFIKLKMEKPDLFQIAVDMEEAYFKARPERRNGFIEGLKLIDLQSMPTLFSFEQLESIQNDQKECDSGGCFL